MVRTRTKVIAGLVALAAGITSSPVMAQDMFIYPADGQSQEQQDRDRFECHSWAVQQTGFDPTNPSSVPQASQSAQAPQQEAQQDKHQQY